ncbi:hypothetical protein N7447_007242 [Penicillium robsamsonii]|uniref:uncharacterized protein n=1 Tax=Penicillium robsamsonii TaxID=1792511 RepID=UPI002548661D|nr:uncharacterized protein N7447_007242 [Penicillium robsamsonii]KAJ5824902.1 hypothetical protein N7447_007242 [Penicillium robsamsonii]
MTDSTQPFCSNDDYTVGWICALPTELAAAKGMLDEVHGDPQIPPAPADNNTYILGSMGKFKVVIAALPLHQLGSFSAAAAAREMLFTFPKIRVGLLVGIGAGIPDYENDQDIRLGDVVIGSHPENGGVVVYDFGKQLADGSFQSISALNRPPRSLLSALSKLKADHEMEGNRISQYVTEMLDKYPMMRKKGYSHPDPASDRIFQSDYLHPNNAKSCAKCDLTKQIDRDEFERFDEYPVIHYGTIASGNSVVKNSSKRDAIRDQHGAICLEMEAAGLMNNFPCVVIRGICDYADSHKNDRWQPFAAAAAAACAKEFLEKVQPNVVDSEPPAKDIICRVHEEVKAISNNVKIIGHDMEMISRLVIDDQTQKILDWLSPIEIERQQSDVINQRQEGTGLWFLESSEFLQWLSRPKATILCAGIPGSGKTVISSIVADFLSTKFEADPKVQIAQVFCSYQSHSQQSTLDILLSLLRQLAINDSNLFASIEEMHEKHAKKRTRPKAMEVEELLLKSALVYTKVFVIIDALDEYCSSKPDQIDDLLSTLFRLEQKMQLSIFATSRFNSEIQIHFKSCLFKEIRTQDGDLLMYVNRRIPQLVRSKISRYPETQQEVRRCLLESSNGMFLLAKLHMDHLMSFPTIGQLEESLASLRHGRASLGTAYDNAISRITSQQDALSDMAMKTLCWLTFSRRTLTPRELQHALCVRPGMNSIDERFLPDIEIIDSLCAGLVMFDRHSRLIRLVHQTTHEYLIGHLALRNAEVDITTASITYLSCVADIPMDLSGYRSLTIKYPLYAYCATWWAWHASAALRVSKEILNLVLEFLEEERTVVVTCLAQEETYTLFLERRSSKAHIAAFFGLNDAVISYRNTGQDLDIGDWRAETPLMYAVANGNLETTRILLENPDINPHARGRYGDTALWKAVVRDEVDIVKEVLLYGVSPNGPQRYDCMALHRATLQENLEIMKVLVDHGADVNLISLGETPLMISCSIGSVKATEFLLNNGADPNMSNKYGRTPLSSAAAQGDEHMTGAFYEPEMFNRYGRTPLSSTAGQGDEHMTGVFPGIQSLGLSDFDVKPHIVLERPSGFNSEDYLSVVKLLLRKGVHVNCQDITGNTPLFGACLRGDWKVVDILLGNGADINHRNILGETPLFFATMCGSPSLIKILFENHAMVESKNVMGETPFVYASRCLKIDERCHAVMVAFLERGADPEPLYDPTKNRDQKEFLTYFLHKLTSSESLAVLTRKAPPSIKRAWRVWLQKHNGIQVNELLWYLRTCWRLRECQVSYNIINFWRQIWIKGKSSVWLDAVEGGHVDLVRTLLKSAPSGQGDAERNTSLFEVATELEHVGISKMLLEAGLDESTQTASHNFLMRAAGNNNVELMILLFSHFEFNATDEYEPLLLAARKGHLDAVGFLLSKLLFSDFRMRRQKGRRKWLGCLWGANWRNILKSQNADQIKRQRSRQKNFLRRKRLLNGHRTKMSEDSCHAALCQGRLEDLEGYLPRRRKGIYSKAIDKKDRHGRTLLFWAVQQDWRYIVYLLLRLGANPNTTEAGAGTPLLANIKHYADHWPSVSPLMRRLDAFNGQTPLFFAAGRGSIQMVKLLLRYGADPDHQSASGDRPISWAAGRGHQIVVSTLLRKRCNANYDADPLQSPLLWAVGSYNHDLKVKCNRGIMSPFNPFEPSGQPVALLLLQYGADPNVVDWKGQDVLFIAIKLRFTDLVKVLLKSDRDPNPRNTFGRTPLMNATMGGMDPIITLLRESPKIDLDATDDFGRTISMEVARMKISHTVNLQAEHSGDQDLGPMHYSDNVQWIDDPLEYPDMTHVATCDVCWLLFHQPLDDSWECDVHQFVLCDDCRRLGAVCPFDNDEESPDFPIFSENTDSEWDSSLPDTVSTISWREIQ